MGVNQSKAMLGLISDALCMQNIEAVEVERLNKDLLRVQQRLIKREYAQTDFAGNTFNVPERTREFFTYLNSYFLNGQTWAKVLARLEVQQYDTLIDLCPGWSPKVELGLFYLGYKGEVVLADICEDSMRQVCNFMQLFSPAYCIKQARLDLFERHLLRGDFVLGNHVIDDLILAHVAKNQGFDLSVLYSEEESMRRAWGIILAAADSIKQQVVPVLASAFLQVVKPNGVLVLSQYKSYMDNLLDLDAVVLFCKEVLADTISFLESQGFVNDKEIVGNCLSNFSGYFSAEDCFVLRRTSAN